MAQFRLLYEVVDPQIDANYKISKNVPAGQVGLSDLREASVGFFKSSQYQLSENIGGNITIKPRSQLFDTAGPISQLKRSSGLPPSVNSPA